MWKFKMNKSSNICFASDADKISKQSLVTFWLNWKTGYAHAKVLFRVLLMLQSFNLIPSLIYWYCEVFKRLGIWLLIICSLYMWIACKREHTYVWADGRSENPGGPSSNVMGIICPPPAVGMVLTNRPKSGGWGLIPPSAPLRSVVPTC